MTWYFDPVGKTVTIYDHTGVAVLENESYPGVWDDDAPDIVWSTMQAAAEQAVANNNTGRAIKILADAAFEDIEEGVPWQRVNVGTDTLSLTHPTPTLSAPASISVETEELTTSHPTPSITTGSTQ